MNAHDFYLRLTSLWQPASSLVTPKHSELYWSDYHIVLLLIIAVLTRILHADVSLWLDETWVANSVLSDDITGMFYYESWLQTSPPLFLLLIRLTVKLFGVSHLTLRAVPILFGTVAVILLIAFVRKFLEKPYVLLCALLLVFNPTAIHHSMNLKQYSTDMFTTLILLLSTYGYLEDPKYRRYVSLLATFTIGLLLSYTAMFLVPGGIYALSVSRVKSYSRLLPFIVLVSLVTIGNYIILIRPNAYPHLFDYYASAFPNDYTASGIISFYIGNLPSLAGLFVPNRYLTETVQLAILAVIGAGVVHLLLFSRGEKQLYWDLFVLFALPFVSLVVANLIGKYPYGVTKVNFFILPVFLVLFVFGLMALRKMADRLLGTGIGRISGYCVHFGSVAGGIAFLLLFSRFDISRENAEGAVKYLRDNLSVEDSLYVHTSMVEQFKFYCNIAACDNIHYYYGSTGAPCCMRKPLRDNSIEGLHADLSNFMNYKAATRRWFLFRDSPSHWEFVGRDESQLSVDTLKVMNCEREKVIRSFRGTVIYSVICG
jgi:uncharacterized membrane protein